MKMMRIVEEKRRDNGVKNKRSMEMKMRRRTQYKTGRGENVTMKKGRMQRKKRSRT